MRRWHSLCAVMVVSSAAWAQVKPPVVAYPLDVLVRGVTDAQVKELQAESRRLLGLEASLPDGLTLDAALTMLERKDCDVDDGCLKQFALNAKSLYALYVVLESDAKQKQIIAKGRVVREDGVLVVPSKSVTVVRKPKDTVDAALKEALKALYAELKVSALPPTRELPKKDPDPLVKKDPDPIKKDPELPPPPPPVVDLAAGQRTAGTGLLVGGAIAFAAGVALTSGGLAMGYGADLDKDGNVDSPQRVPDVKTGQALSTTGLIVGGVGVVAVGIGAVLAVTAGAPPKTSVNFVPVAGGGVVQIGGQF